MTGRQNVSTAVARSWMLLELLPVRWDRREAVFQPCRQWPVTTELPWSALKKPRIFASGAIGRIIQRARKTLRHYTNRKAEREAEYATIRRPPFRHHISMDGKPSDTAIHSTLRFFREQASSLRWSAAFLILPLVAYGLYVTQQFHQLEDQSQRELGHAALVLESTIEKARQNVAQLESDYLCQFTLEQPYLELLGPCKLDKFPDANAAPRLVAALGGLQIARGPNDELKFRVRVNNLLQELSFPESFHTLALIGQDGALLLTVDAQQPVWLRQLRLGERELREPAFGDDPPLLLVDLKRALSASAAKPDFDEARASASRIRAEIAGKSYQVYLQPLRFQEADKDKGRQLLLVGLRPTVDALRQSLAFDTYFLAFLLLLLVGLCLGLPFFKLWALNRRERFRVRDLLLLYLSTGALLSLCATVVLAVDGYVGYQSLTSEILSGLHSKIERDLVGELRAARRQLVAYDSCAASLDLLGSPPAEPVQVDQVAWADRTGKQVGKIVPTAEKASLVSVAHRTYFRSIVSDSLWLLPDDAADSASRVPFYFGPGRSITDGQFYSFFSIRSSTADCDRKPDAGKTVAAVLTFSLHSLAPRPLPASFGFALINREGTVLYHSDDRISLRQNLIHETGDPARLRAALLGGGEARLGLSYFGRPHRFLLRPVKSLRVPAGQASGALYLAVFQDLSVARYIASLAFLSCMLWPQALFALWMAAAMIVASWVSRRRTQDRNWRQWLWTQPERGSQYRRNALLLFSLLAIAFGLQAAGVTYMATLLLPIAAPVAALAMVVWTPAPAPAKSSANTFETAVRWHRLLLLALSVCMSMAPATALYQIIWSHELGKLVIHERNQAASMSEDLPLRTSLRLTRENVPVPWIRHGRMAREKYMAIGISLATDDSVTLTGPDWIHRWQDQAAWALPMRNETAISLRGLSAPPFAPVGAGWGPIPRCAPLLAAMAGLIWILYWWTGWNARHILLSGHRIVGPPDILPVDPDAWEAAWVALPRSEQCLLVQTALEKIANPHQSDTVVSLVSRGWLVLSPEIRPASPALQSFLLDPARRECLEYEQVQSVPSGEHSWRSVRKSLLVGVGIAVLFLFSTQPALPVDFLGLLSIVTGTLGGAVKAMDSVNNWLSRSAAARP